MTNENSTLSRKKANSQLVQLAEIILTWGFLVVVFLFLFCFVYRLHPPNVSSQRSTNRWGNKPPWVRAGKQITDLDPERTTDSEISSYRTHKSKSEMFKDIIKHIWVYRSGKYSCWNEKEILDGYINLSLSNQENKSFWLF